MLHVYDRGTDTIFSGGIPTTINSSGSGTADISPDANYVVTMAGNSQYLSYAVDHASQTVSSSGTMYWSLCGGHHALASTSDGKTYMFVANCFDEGSVFRVDVSLPQTTGNVAQQKSQNVRLFFTDGTEDAEHFSCAAKGLNQDWCFVSIESQDDLFANQGTWRPYKSEIVMAQMVPPYTVRRLAHYRSRSLGSNYYYQPRLSANWDGTKIAWSWSVRWIWCSIVSRFFLSSSFA